MTRYIKTYTILLILTCMLFVFTPVCNAKKYDTTLSKSQRDSLCQQLINQSKASPTYNGSLGGGIIPENVFTSLFSTTKNISDSTAILLTLGHSLTCHAVHAGRNSVNIGRVKVFSYPDFSVWLCGLIIYFVGFMLTLSITFYVADIAFKLGFAVIMLPIGIALWPFPITKDKLSTLISIILKSAAIFIFLAITVSYALNLISQAVTMEIDFDTPISEEVVASLPEASGFEKIFALVNNNMTDLIAENFTIFSTFFLVMMFALMYGFQLIGSAIPDYADKIFPDNVFGGASPMHHTMTQGMDFVKQHTVDRAASYASDVIKTQTGRALEGTGKLISGQYNGQIKNFVKNPGDIGKNIAHSVHNIGGSVAKGASSVLTGTVGRLVMGKEASTDLKNKIHAKIDEGTNYLDKKADNVAQQQNEQAHARQEAKQKRRDERKEEFDNSAIGKVYNETKESFNRSGIGKTYGKITRGIKKGLKATARFTGKVLEKTGDEMQRNKQQKK
ncbi:MAG: hypothetical protein IJ019_04830 [Alphaproteobacteria bacterium]|nr:hypothetical protein [Alphaproteobacteria bacterium]